MLITDDKKKEEVVLNANPEEFDQGAIDELKEEVNNREPRFKYGVVSGAMYLRVRDGYDGEEIGRLKKGDRVKIIGIDGPWTEMRFGKLHGFVMTKFLTLSE